MSNVPTALSLLHWRLLTLSDLDVMEALHRLSMQGMGPQMVKPESRSFLASLLQGRGSVIGAWAGSDLVAYGVLQHDLLPEDDPRHHLGLSAQQPLAKLAGAAVAPAWRRQGLQRALVAKRVACAGSNGVLFATAAPENTASWHNLLACGFTVRALEYRYGGFARYLLVRDVASLLLHNEAVSAGVGCELDGAALSQQQALFLQGWHGVLPGSTVGSLRLLPPPVGAR